MKKLLFAVAMALSAGAVADDARAKRNILAIDEGRKKISQLTEEEKVEIKDFIFRFTEELKNKTIIEASPVGAKIIVSGEYVGNAPVAVKLPDYASDYGSISVMALPAGQGCVASTRISKGDRIPKRMFLDTNLCPMQPSIDLNIND